MRDPVYRPAHVLAAAIRDRRITASEVMEAHLDRIAALNPALNAIVTLDADGARAQARAADAAVTAGRLLGPLHGVPMTLKDGHATRGMRTTVGMAELADHVPDADGTVAARLRRAGAIIIGKTNVPPRLRDAQSANPIFGRTSNPWDLGRTPGGSSGGAAAAVAAGLVPAEVGSDAGGSIRWPAHFCGIFGFKPTGQLVPATGSYADPPGLPQSLRILMSLGPMARDVDDLILLMGILAGPDGIDSEVPPVAFEPAPVPPIETLRVACVPTFPDVPVAEDIAAAVEGLGRALSDRGARVAEALPNTDFPGERQVFAELIGSLSRAVHPESDQPPATLAAYLRALDRRADFIRTWEAFFADRDALICPVAMCTAFPHCESGTPLKVDGIDEPYWTLLDHCCRFNLTGHPAAVVPAGLDRAGLPIGVQVVGPRWGDAGLLAVVKAVASLAGGFRPPPGY